MVGITIAVRCLDSTRGAHEVLDDPEVVKGAVHCMRHAHLNEDGCNNCPSPPRCEEVVEAMEMIAHMMAREWNKAAEANDQIPEE